MQKSTIGLALSLCVALAPFAAQAVLSTGNTCATCNTQVDVNPVATLHLHGDVTVIDTPSQIIYQTPATSSTILSSHDAGTIVQSAKVTLPAGTVGVKVNPNVSGENASHATVVLRGNLNSSSDTANKQATLGSSDDLYVALVNSDGVQWSPGSTYAAPVVTFYKS